LPHFRDIAAFAGFAQKLTPTPFLSEFRGVPAWADHRCWDRPEPKPEAYQLWNYFQSVPTYVISVSRCYRQMDGWLIHLSSHYCVRV